MSSDDVQIVSRELGVELPSRYVEFLRRFPRDLKVLSYDYGNWRARICDEQFLASASALIKLNRQFREWPHSAEPAVHFDCSAYLAIGSDIGGNYYLIRLKEDTPRVYFFDRQTGDTIDQSESLDVFAELLIQDWKEWHHPKV